MAGRPKKIVKLKEVLEAPTAFISDSRSELLNLLKARMPACFDREPQGMNSNVEKLTDEIIGLLK